MLLKILIIIMIIKRNVYVIIVIIYETYQALHAHYKKDSIRNTLYQIDKLTPTEWPNGNCNTSWANAKELAKILNITPI